MNSENMVEKYTKYYHSKMTDTVLAGLLLTVVGMASDLWKNPPTGWYLLRALDMNDWYFLV